MPDVFIALVHFPVYNKNREIIAAAITTIDLHDLARLAATYGLAGFFVTTPLDDQVSLAEELIRHWRTGWGAAYNNNRAQAVELIHLLPDLEAAVAAIESRCGMRPLVVGSSAHAGSDRIGFSELKQRLAESRPILILFGTGWGLTTEVLDRCDHLLEPINGPTDYNHLSVRAAAAVILDRLLGQGPERSEYGGTS